MATEGIPEVLWLGKKPGEWPIMVMETETQALDWLRAAPDGEACYLWRVMVARATPYRLVETAPRLERVQPE